MITGIHSTFYWAREMNADVAFYRDTLGLPLVFRYEDDWAQFDVGGIPLALHGVRTGAPVEPGATVVFEVDDLEATMRALSARGVRFEGDVTEVPDTGRFASFRDPSGNLLQIFETRPGGAGG